MSERSVAERRETERLHEEVGLSGFRAHAAAIGLLQLIRELRRAGTLDGAAVDRIRDAIIADLSLSKPLHSGEDEFRERLRSRLDRLMRPDA